MTSSSSSEQQVFFLEASSSQVMEGSSSSTSSYSSNEYFGDFFFALSQLYLPIHGYLSLIVCIFGIFANILNIVVLTRKEMASATNAILTGLALADLVVMIEYIPFTIHSSIEVYESEEEKYSYPWAIFTLFHAHFSVIFHSISTWLTVILAVWRFTSVSFPTESKVWCSMANAKRTIALTYVIVPIICFPVYLTFAIHSATEGDVTTYFVNYSDISLKNNGLLKNINFWVFSVGLKLVPCILLTYLSVALIRVLLEAEKRRERLKCTNIGLVTSNQNISVNSEPNRVNQCINRKASDQSGHNSPPDRQPATAGTPPGRVNSDEHLINVATPNQVGNNNNSLQVTQVGVDGISSTPSTSVSVAHSTRPPLRHIPSAAHGHTQSQSDRTTRMLVAILLLFLVTEFPSGSITLLSGFLGESFHANVYLPLGEIFDILALINSGINFILYCVMSRLFRKTFCKIFWPQRYHRRNMAASHARTQINVTPGRTPTPDIRCQTPSVVVNHQQHLSDLRNPKETVAAANQVNVHLNSGNFQSNEVTTSV